MNNRMPIVITFFLSLAVSAQQEKRTTQITRGLMPFTETKDYMLGNNDFGFFIQNLDSAKAICRTRFKIECDYGLGTVKPIKNTIFKILIDQDVMEIKSDDTGLIDGWFRCNPNTSKKTIKVSVKKFEASYKAESFPKTISITENQCW